MSAGVVWCVCMCLCSFLQDKQEIPWWLGVSYKGIGQYDLQDKLKPRKVGLFTAALFSLTVFHLESKP